MIKEKDDEIDKIFEKVKHLAKEDLNFYDLTHSIIRITKEERIKIIKDEVKEEK